MARADIPAAAAMEATVPGGWSAVQLADELAAAGGFQFACRDRAGDCLGYICGRLAAGEAEILKIAVRPSHRRQGLGLALLGHVLSWLGGQGAVCCFLEVRQSNHAARALYQKAGFQVVGARRNYYRQPSEDALLLRRDIEQRPPEANRQDRVEMLA